MTRTTRVRAMGFVDLHFHVIPDVDDGPQTPDEALQMLHLAHVNGTRRVVATPHMFSPRFSDNDPASIREAFDKLTAGLEQSSEEHPFLTEMTLDLGAENYLSREFFDALEGGDILTMDSGRYTLVEFSPYTPLSQVSAWIERLHEAGYRAIVAHVERYPTFQEKPERLRTLSEAGCIIQLSTCSLLGRRGGSLRRLSLQLLTDGLIDVISSDAHDAVKRVPNLGNVARFLEKRFPAESIEAWCAGTARRILDGASDRSGKAENSAPPMAVTDPLV